MMRGLRWVRRLLGRAVRGAAGSRCLAPFLERYYKDDIFILNMHRVYPRDSGRLAANEGLKISPESLELFVKTALAQGYNFLSLDQLHAMLRGEAPFRGRSFVLTFDDGYRDNMALGLPILKKHSVPFAVYLSPWYGETQEEPWWYTLENLVTRREGFVWNGAHVNCPKGALREELFMRVRAEVLTSRKGAQACVRDLALANGLTPPLVPGMFLSWKDVRALADEPLLTFGNHGYTHPNLTLKTEDEIRGEFMRVNKAFLEHTGRVLQHYAYPYGLYSGNALAVLRQLEAKTCVTTQQFSITRDHVGGGLLELPRVGLGDGDTPGSIMAKSFCFRLKKLIKGVSFEHV